MNALLCFLSFVSVLLLIAVGVVAVILLQRLQSARERTSKLVLQTWSWARKQYKSDKISLGAIEDLHRQLTVYYGDVLPAGIELPPQSSMGRSPQDAAERAAAAAGPIEAEIVELEILDVDEAGVEFDLPPIVERPRTGLAAAVSAGEVHTDSSPLEQPGPRFEPAAQPEQVSAEPDVAGEDQPLLPVGAAAGPDKEIEFHEPIADIVAATAGGGGTGVATTTHPLDRDSRFFTPVPRAPRKPLTETLRAFMSERNIHWGELLSGILIVGSALGLVLSLRTQFEQTIPYFSSLMFLLLTAAMHGTGHYTLRRWKLQTTSRGVLVIGSLLIPLNLLLGCLLAIQGEQLRSLSDPVYWAAIGLGGASLFGLAYAAGRCLTPQSRLAWPLALLGTSFPLLWINRIAADATTLWPTLVMVVPPTVAYLAALILANRRDQPDASSSPEESRTELMTLGRVAGGGALALGGTLLFFLWRSTDALQAVREASAGWAILAVSMAYLSGRLRRYPTADNSAITLLVSITQVSSILLGLGALAVAWPHFDRFILTSLLLTAGWFASGWWWRQNSQIREGLALSVATLTCLTTRLAVSAGWLPESAALTLQGTWFSWPAVLTYMTTGAALLVVARRTPSEANQLADPSVRVMLRSQSELGAVLVTVGAVISFWMGFSPGTLFDHLFATITIATAALSCGAIALLKRRLDLAMVWTILAPLVGLIVVFRLLPHWDLPFNSESFGWRLAAVGLGVAGMTVLTGGIRQLHSAARWQSGSLTLSEDVLAPLLLNLHVLLAAAGLLPLAHAFATGLEWNHVAPIWGTLVVWTGLSVLGRRIEILSFARGLAYLVITLSVIATWLAARGEITASDIVLLGWVELGVAGWLMAMTLVNWTLDRSTAASWAQPAGEVDRCAFTLLLAFLVVQSFAVADLKWLGLLLPGDAPAVLGDWLGQWWLGWLSILVLLTSCVVVDSRRVWRWSEVGNGFWLWGLTISWISWLAIWSVFEMPPSLRWAWWSALAVAAAGGWSWLQRARQRTSDELPATKVRLPYWETAVIAAAVFAAIELLVLTAGQGQVLATAGERAATGLMVASLWQLSAPWALLAAGIAMMASGVRPLSYFVTSVALIHVGAGVCGHLLTSGGWLQSQWLSDQLLIHALLGWAVFGALTLAARLPSFAAFQGGAGGVPPLQGYARVILLVSGAIGLVNLSAVIGLWTGVVDFWPVNWGHLLAWGIGVAVIAYPLQRVLEAGVVVALGMLTVGMLAGLAVGLGANTATASLIMSGGLLLTLAACLAGEIFLEQHGFDLSVGNLLRRTSQLLLTGLVYLAGSYGVLHFSAWPWMTLPLGGLAIVLLVLLEIRYRDLLQRSLTVVLLPATVWALLTLQPLAAVPWLIRHPLAWTAMATLFVGAVTPWLERVVPPSSARRFGARPWRPMDWAHWLIALGLVFPATVLAVDAVSHQHAGGEYWLANGQPWLLLTTLVFALASFSHLWHRRQLSVVAMLLVSGHVLVMLLASFPQLIPAYATSILALAYGAFVAAVGWSAPFGSPLLVHARRLGWTQLTMERAVARILVPSWVLISAVLGLVLLCQLHFMSESRLLKLAITGSWCLITLSAFVVVPREWPGRRFGIILASFIVGYSVLWSDLGAWLWTPDQIVRVTRTILAMLLGTLIYGAVLPRLVQSQAWLQPLRAMSQVTAAGVLLGMLVLVPMEIAVFDSQTGLPLPLDQSLMVTGLLTAFATLAIVIAVVPDRFKWPLTEQQRQGLVYLAEFCLGLTVLHVYLAFPWLFQGVLRQYWPFLLLLGSLAGSLLGHFLRRQGSAALGLPILRTATWAPLVPAVGLLFLPSGPDYSLVMAATGLLYLLALAPIHQNWNYSWITAVCFNVAIVHFWSRFDFLAFEKHPQVWLIIPALTVLVALHLRRRDLPAPTVALGRYLCMAVIYVSSTWEIFEGGIGESLWPPMVLAVLALVGAFVGIAMHIRGFVYFGTLFLLLSVLTMVAHAHRALDHTWPWWLFGIVSGIAILVFFGLLERRSDKAKEYWQHWRQWEA